ncbi:MAG: hypothetical protein IJX17_05075 [Clostridia bacterium]|nr:hypothetical protein [Clostridia bacterium]
MFLVRIFTVITNLFAARTIDPAIINGGSSIWLGFSGLMTFLMEWFVETVLYSVAKFLMALMDFLQYFIQKLIGLDYWLNADYYSIEGALDADLLFSFIFDETVQKTFKALVGLFVVLLIVFTIFAIIRSEWQYITGGKGGQFGDGSNSKTSIIRSALKAIMLVMVFPLIMIIGIMSSNAILASLVKALNINTGSTFGAAMFNVASQSANKYKNYATSSRVPVVDEVTFYIGNMATEGVMSETNGKYIYLSTADVNNTYSRGVKNYETYLALTSVASKHTVYTMFEPVNCMKEEYFEGYCARLDIEDVSYWYFVKTNSATYPVKAESMRYYLQCVLGLPLVTRNDPAGNSKLLSEIKSRCSISNDGFISGSIKSVSNKNEMAKAVWNTWGYVDIFANSFEFDETVFYSTLKQKSLIKDNTQLKAAFGFSDSTSGSLINALGFSDLDNVKVMFNSDTISPYFDLGQLGMVHLQSEYLVMADLVDFMAQNDLTLYMMNANSEMIDWDHTGYSAKGTQWVGDLTVKTGSSFTSHQLYNSTTSSAYQASYKNTRDTVIGNKIPLVVSYSDIANDIDSGNNLYLADLSASNEKDGAVYIMCYKVVDGTSTKYVPILHRTSYKNPISGDTYFFSSKFLTTNYNGVIVARGLMDTGADSTDRSLGRPTYIENSTYDKSGNEINSGKGYYYEMVDVGSIETFAQYGIHANKSVNSSYKDLGNITFTAGTNGSKIDDLESKINLSVSSVYLKNHSNILADHIRNSNSSSFQFLTNNDLSITNVKIRGLESNSENKFITGGISFIDNDGAVLVDETEKYYQLPTTNKTSSKYTFHFTEFRNVNLGDFAISIKDGSGDKEVTSTSGEIIYVQNDIYAIKDADGNNVFFKIKVTPEAWSNINNGSKDWHVQIDNSVAFTTGDISFSVKDTSNNTYSPTSLGGDKYAVNVGGKWYFFTLKVSGNKYSITNEVNVGINDIGVTVNSYSVSDSTYVLKKSNQPLTSVGDNQFVYKENDVYYILGLNYTSSKLSYGSGEVSVNNDTFSVKEARQDLKFNTNSNKYITIEERIGTNTQWRALNIGETFLSKITVENSKEANLDHSSNKILDRVTSPEYKNYNGNKIYQYKIELRHKPVPSGGDVTEYFYAFLKLVNEKYLYLAEVDTWMMTFDNVAFNKGDYQAVNKTADNVISFGAMLKEVNIEASNMNFDETKVTQNEEEKYEIKLNTTDGYCFTVDKLIKRLDDTGEMYADPDFTLSPDTMKHLLIKIPYTYTSGSKTYNTTFNAKCVDSTTITSVKNNSYLFTFVAEDGRNYYFVINVLEGGKSFAASSYNSTGEVTGNMKQQTNKKITAVSNDYLVSYNFCSTTTDVGNIAVEDFSYAKNVVRDGETYQIFTTSDRQYIQATKKYDYLSLVFKTKNDSKELIYFDSKTIEFARPVSTEKCNYNSAFVAFFLYDYYHGIVKDGTDSDGSGVTDSTTYGAIHRYSVGSDSVSDQISRYDVTKPSDLEKLAENEDIIFCFIDSSFNWISQSSTQGLYNGKAYVAQLYKNKGVTIDNISDIRLKSLELLHDNNTYYNIHAQNSYASKTELKDYYGKIKDQSFIRFNRTNYKSKVV